MATAEVPDPDQPIIEGWTPPDTRQLDHTVLSALGFAADQAIKAGLLDRYLHVLAASIRARQRLTDPPQPKRTPEMEAAGQVWAAMHRPDGTMVWEVRGTGALL